MDSELDPAAYALLLFVGMIAFGELGRRFARMRSRRDPQGTSQGIGIIDGALFSLLGLVIAFTFSGANARLDARRHLIVQETNAIGTAYLRLDLLPDAARSSVRDKFRQYAEARVRAYNLLPDVEATLAELRRSKSLQDEIWPQALAGAQNSSAATMLLLPALNEVFDISTTRTMTLFVHPPLVVFAMLFALACISAAAAGRSTGAAATRDRFQILVFSAVITTVFYVIIDLEYPRRGYIKVAEFDRALQQVLKSVE